MNCTEFKQQLEQQGRQGLSDEALRHERECELCHGHVRDEQLREALVHMPLPEPGEGFADRVIGGAVRRNAHRRLVAGSGIAAVLTLAVILSLLLDRPQSLTGTVAGPATVQETTVRVMIEASEAREDATLTIDLAENLELKGYPERRRIAWRTDVKQGKNLLELPLKIESGDDGYVNISYSYNGSRKELQIPVRGGSARS